MNTLPQATRLERAQYHEAGSRPRDEYQLTDVGRQLAVVLGALQQWGDEHLPWPEKSLVSWHQAAAIGRSESRSWMRPTERSRMRRLSPCSPRRMTRPRLWRVGSELAPITAASAWHCWPLGRLWRQASSEAGPEEIRGAD